MDRMTFVDDQEQRRPSRELTRRMMISRVVNLGAHPGSGVSYSIHRVSQNAAAAREIGEYLWSRLRDHGIQYLIAPGSGAAPVAAAIGAAALRDNVVLETLHIRDPKRARAGERLVEGFLPNHPVRAAFVDDVITAGGTFKRSLATLADYTDKIECVAIALVFDSFHPKGSRRLIAEGMPVYALMDRREIGLTRDSSRRVADVFSAPLWIRAGLVSRPQYQRKTVPIVTADAVICGLDDCSVEAYGVEDGQRLWRLESPFQRSKGSSCELLLSDEGILYSGSYAGLLTASRNGDIVWRYRIAHALHSRPTLVSGRLYQNVEDFQDRPLGRLVCLDAATGQLLWEVPHHHFGPTGVAVADGVAVTANNAAELIGVSLEGAVLWRHRMQAMMRGRALLLAGRVIYLDESGNLVKLDLHSGEEIQRTRFSKSAAHSEPLLVDGVLVVTDNSMHLAGYDPDTFERLWINRLRGACQWRPTVYKHYLLTQTTEGALAATIAATGEKIWERKRPYRWSTSPMGVSDTHAAIMSLDGRLTFHKLEI